MSSRISVPLVVPELPTNSLLSFTSIACIRSEASPEVSPPFHALPTQMRSLSSDES